MANTPPVDLFAIEHQSRDSSVPAGIDGIKCRPTIHRRRSRTDHQQRNQGSGPNASNTASVLSFDAFNASRNFRDPKNIKRQNGIVFFPGSSALYDDVLGMKVLVGGLGVSGDGVDQDDVVTVRAQQGFGAPDPLRSDQFVVAGVRLPYQNFNRNPRG